MNIILSLCLLPIVAVTAYGNHGSIKVYNNTMQHIAIINRIIPSAYLQSFHDHSGGQSGNDSDSQSDNNKPASLDEILKKEIHAAGAIRNVLSGLTLCYNVVANLLLYPIFSFLLLALSLGAMVIAGFWIKKIKQEEPISALWMLMTSLYILCYIDLFLVVFQQRKVLLLCLELERDLLLMVVAASIGYVVGKFFSHKSFEEKEIP